MASFQVQAATGRGEWQTRAPEATMLATFGGHAVDVLVDQALYESFLEQMKNVPFDRRDVKGTARRVVLALARQPWWVLPTFFIQNFMDADALDPERIADCSFMVMTDDGPVSMCAHNARRDDYRLKPLALPSRPASRLGELRRVALGVVLPRGPADGRGPRPLRVQAAGAFAGQVEKPKTV